MLGQDAHHARSEDVTYAYTVYADDPWEIDEWARYTLDLDSGTPSRPRAGEEECDWCPEPARWILQVKHRSPGVIFGSNGIAACGQHLPAAAEVALDHPHRSGSPQLHRFDAQDDDLDDESPYHNVGPTVRLDFDSGREVTRD